MYFRLNNDDIRRQIDLLYKSYKTMIAAAVKAFTRSRGERGILEYGGTGGREADEETVREIMSKRFAPYFAADDAVMPLPQGYTYTRTASQSGTREHTDPADTRKLISDVFDMAALAFRIPPAMLRGEMADVSQLTGNFLTFCIDPLARQLEVEINRKLYTPEQYMSGNRIAIDTSKVKHFELLDSATAVDKLVSSGTVSVNELRAALGLEAIDEDWARQHYITRNYALIEELGNTPLPPS